MLGKVFKHEMKSTSRLFLPLMIGFIAITLLCKFTFETSYSAILGSGIPNQHTSCEDEHSDQCKAFVSRPVGDYRRCTVYLIHLHLFHRTPELQTD